MGAGHEHGVAVHGAGQPGDFRGRLWIAFSITAVVVVAQAVGAVITGSLALLTDTAHALADAVGLLVALIAATLMLRPADPRRTWGFRRIEVIAALILSRAVTLLRETAAVLMEFTPKGLDLEEVRSHILALDHLRDVHDLHASTVATGLPTLTAHVVVERRVLRGRSRSRDAARGTGVRRQPLRSLHPPLDVPDRDRGDRAAGIARDAAPLTWMERHENSCTCSGSWRSSPRGRASACRGEHEREHRRRARPA